MEGERNGRETKAAKIPVAKNGRATLSEAGSSHEQPNYTHLEVPRMIAGGQIAPDSILRSGVSYDLDVAVFFPNFCAPISISCALSVSFVVVFLNDRAVVPNIHCFTASAFVIKIR